MKCSLSCSLSLCLCASTKHLKTYQHYPHSKGSLINICFSLCEFQIVSWQSVSSSCKVYKKVRSSQSKQFH
ncbi:hypothetical protein JTB14_002326 [Gonioctena quinquepunctata]|nr:hypothetical protein JTB14_002326 [Gonioctena quinquepunctata]